VRCTYLKYLAPYILRVAISNNRIVKVADDQVTFRYKDANTRKNRHCTVTAEEFIRRSLRVQHVLPKGFVKVRYYGFFSPTHRHSLDKIRQLIEVQGTGQPSGEPEVGQVAQPQANSSLSGQAQNCPKCGRVMRLVETLKPQRRRPP
jgi:hypothetical protein